MEVGEELKQPGDGSWELGVGEESRVRQMGDRMTMEKCEKNLLLPGS